MDALEWLYVCTEVCYVSTATTAITKYITRQPLKDVRCVIVESIEARALMSGCHFTLGSSQPVVWYDRYRCKY